MDASKDSLTASSIERTKEVMKFRWCAIMKSALDQDLTHNDSSYTVYGNGIVYGINWTTGMSYMVGAGALNIVESFEEIKA